MDGFYVDFFVHSKKVNHLCFYNLNRTRQLIVNDMSDRREFSPKMSNLNQGIIYFINLKITHKLNRNILRIKSLQKNVIKMFNKYKFLSV